LKKRLRNIDNLVVFLAFLLVWEISVKRFHIQEWILPGPIQILQALWNARELIIYHSKPTIIEAIAGLSIAALFGVGISTAMQWSARLEKIIYPFLILSQTVPFIVLAPLLTVWFGFGIMPKIIVIALVCFFPITINLFDGFRSVDHDMKRFMISIGATKWQLFKFVTFPASLPSFFSGLKVAAAYCVLGAVVAEWIGTDRGLGILLIRSAKSYLIDRVFATIFIITLFSVIVVVIVEGIARIFIPWHFYKNNSNGRVS